MKQIKQIPIRTVHKVASRTHIALHFGYWTSAAVSAVGAAHFSMYCGLAFLTLLLPYLETLADHQNVPKEVDYGEG